MPIVRGLAVDDDRPGCAHWRTPCDIVAIRFFCCGEFYACYDCHAACAGHEAIPWPRAEWGEDAILCRACGTEMSIEAYMQADSQCPACRAAFNPGCRNHWPLYFAGTERQMAGRG